MLETHSSTFINPGPKDSHKEPYKALHKAPYNIPNEEDIDFNLVTVKREIAKLNFSDLLQMVNCQSYFYFKSKDGESEFLAIDPIVNFRTKKEIDSISKWLEVYPELVIAGSYFFEDNENSEGHFFIPALCIQRVKGSFYFISSHIKTNDLRIDNANTLFSKYMNKNQYMPLENKRQDKLYSPSLGSWSDNVNKALLDIEEGKAKKIVLQRSITETYEHNIDPVHYFLKKRMDQNNYQIIFKMSHDESFISYTPETLFLVKKDLLDIDSLAGSIRRSDEQQKDKDLEIELLKDQKELSEHRFVTEYISGSLESIDLTPHIIFKEKILKLKHIQHIHTKIQAKLNKNINTFDILSKLHPTPAVAGLPRNKSMQSICEIEKEKRKLYASATGYFSCERSEFAVAIRCALIKKNTLRVYGGCGIVKGSQPQKEWDETKNKMKNFISEDI